jgi:hypothetical protein
MKVLVKESNVTKELSAVGVEWFDWPEGEKMVR